jgi:hypothetical protein
MKYRQTALRGDLLDDIGQHHDISNRPGVLTDPRFHRRSDAQGLMNPAEVVVNMEQRHRVNVVFDLFGKAIRQAGEAAHLHSHVEILPFHVAGADMLRIGVAENDLSFGAHTLRGAVPLLAFRCVVVILHELSKVDSIFKQRIGNRLQIHVVAVSSQLNSIRQSLGNILQESGSKPRVSVSNHPRDNKLRIGVDGREGPGVSADARSGHFGRNVLLLRSDERPYLVDLNTLSGNVSNSHVMELGASGSHFGQQAEDSSLRYASHADSGANGRAFHQRRDYRYFLLQAQCGHTSIIHKRFRIAKKKMDACGIKIT